MNCFEGKSSKKILDTHVFYEMYFRWVGVQEVQKNSKLFFSMASTHPLHIHNIIFMILSSVPHWLI